MGFKKASLSAEYLITITSLITISILLLSLLENGTIIFSNAAKEKIASIDALHFSSFIEVSQTMMYPYYNISLNIFCDGRNCYYVKGEGKYPLKPYKTEQKGWLW